MELALRRLRLKESPEIFWVDAISINQEDATEKGHQVGRMDDVYGRAHGVCVWLGEESQDSTLAFDVLCRFGHLRKPRQAVDRQTRASPKTYPDTPDEEMLQ